MLGFICEKLGSSKKRIFILVSILILSILLPLVILVPQQQQTIRQRASELVSPSSYFFNAPEALKEGEFAEGEILVKLKETASVLRVKPEALSQGMDLEEKEVPFSSIQEGTLPSVFNTVNQQYRIKTIEKVFKSDNLPSISPQKSYQPYDKEKNKFSRVYKLKFETNSPVKQIIENLKKDPQVEYAEPNFIMRTQEVPNDPYYSQMWNLSKIQMENAWNITKGSSDVTVAVIDTGIDYTHQELGETIIPEERPFDKITNDPLSLFISPNTRTSQTIAINKNRLAYYSGNKIYIYFFDTATTTTIDIPANEVRIIRLALKDDILVYEADYNPNYYSKPALYLHKLGTNLHKKISEGSTNSVPFEIGNGKVVYTYGGAHVAIYDIQTDKTSIQTNVNTFYFQYISFPKISGNLVAYSRHEAIDPCYQAVVIHNIDNNERKRFFPPDIGPVLDFEDDKILYSSCSETAYYLYDTITGNSQKLIYQLENLSAGEKVESSAFATFVYSLRDDGSLGDNVIFFSEYSTGNGIAAYDQNKNQYIKINMSKPTYNFVAEGKRVCFVSNDAHIYCHTYDPSISYISYPASIFNNRVIGGYNFIYNNKVPLDGHGHGTHVAGTIGAFVNNSTGISGINWDVKLMAIKVLDDNGSGTTDNIIKGIIYATDNGAKIINMSLSGQYSCSQSQALQNTISYARAQSVTIVVAAGNKDSDASTFSPASCNDVITVGATGPTDERSYYSNYGQAVDVSAPGGDAHKCSDKYSCLINSTVPNNQYDYYQGTSMATPHVAGAAALILAKNPNYTPDQVEDVLKNTGKDLVTDKLIGKGLDACKALGGNSCFSIPSPSPTPSPTPTRIPSSTPTPSPAPTAYNRVFVTSTKYSGNLGALSGADAKCQARADAVNLGGTWKAWLSDNTTSAESRLDHSANTCALLDGKTIANNWNDLTDGVLQNGINITELKTKIVPFQALAWTATSITGKTITNRLLDTTTCQDWTSNQDQAGSFGFTGYIGSTNGGWTDSSGIRCNNSFALYCFEQPTPPTPTPSPCSIYGDIDLNGKIDSSDASLMLRYIVGSVTFSSEQKKRADVNGDGKINVQDSILIQQYISKRITVFPVCNKPTSTPTPVSSSLKSTDVCTVCTADINKDGIVNLTDWRAITPICYNKPATGTCAKADIYKNGIVNSADLNCVARNYGKKCSN